MLQEAGNKCIRCGAEMLEVFPRYWKCRKCGHEVDYRPLYRLLNELGGCIFVPGLWCPRVRWEAHTEPCTYRQGPCQHALLAQGRLKDGVWGVWGFDWVPGTRLGYGQKEREQLRKLYEKL